MGKSIEHPLEWDYDSLVVGLDEAGRGPMAGPVVIAGVIFDKGYFHPEIYDSKKVSEKKREKLFDEIKEQALWYKILFVDEKTIDQKNIYRACQDAMFEIASQAKCQVVLTDAMPLPNLNKEVHAIVKGDQKSICIAAASILAKVSRDRYMLKLDRLYPQYGFKNHKGYPTKEHMKALQTYGVLDCHRKSYGPVQEQLQTKLF
ncbi:ribonuclease HII [Floccifex sp.]|uniref:ribonuclease HII n=1 Tax=Floccifex sp. TaxID=2815810 RepID=UPI003F068ACC